MLSLSKSLETSYFCKLLKHNGAKNAITLFTKNFPTEIHLIEVIEEINLINRKGPSTIRKQ